MCVPHCAAPPPPSVPPARLKTLPNHTHRQPAQFRLGRDSEPPWVALDLLLRWKAAAGMWVAAAAGRLWEEPAGEVATDGLRADCSLFLTDADADRPSEVSGARGFRPEWVALTVGGARTASLGSTQFSCARRTRPHRPKQACSSPSRRAGAPRSLGAGAVSTTLKSKPRQPPPPPPPWGPCARPTGRRAVRGPSNGSEGAPLVLHLSVGCRL
jgi:hypothetical protein